MVKYLIVLVHLILLKTHSKAKTGLIDGKWNFERRLSRIFNLMDL